MVEFLKEYFQFLKERKKWFMWPIALLILLIVFLVVTTKGTAVSPFIYTLF